MFLECIKDIKEYNIHKGSLWTIIDHYPKTYFIEIENCDNIRFIINEKWASHFKFLG